MDASFHVDEQGLTHQIDMIDLPMPEDLEDDHDVGVRMAADDQISSWALRDRPFEFRSVYPLDETRPDDTSNPVWIRFREPLADPRRLHQYLLAYASDMGLVSTTMLPHRGVVRRSRIQMASLDHALWFHHDLRVDDWLMYIKETTTGSAARGFNRGSFYTQEGRLVASTMQEGLIRVRTANNDPVAH
jgi:acyl-CoA thioesterase II